MQPWADVLGLIDERYGPDPDMLLDVSRPVSATEPLPLVVWVHGGGFVGGTKEELAGYFKLLASHGFAVVAPRYSLAPGRRYPVPLRQLMQALQYLQANAGRLLIDPDRIALAGDSGQLFLNRLLTFLQRRLAASPPPPDADPGRQPGTAP